MINTILRRHALLVLAGLAAPLWAAKPPAWVRGPDPAYPDAKYVVGVGVGADLDGARSNARAEISRVFQARVQQTMKDIQTERTEALGSRRGPATGTQASEMNTTLSTDTLLEGVVIKKTWFDKRAKKYYALAVLDKTAAQRALSQQITDLEETIAARRAEARKADGPLGRARALAQARTAAQARDALAARRRLVDPAGLAPLNDTNTAEIDADLRAALGRLNVTIEADGPRGSRLEEMMSARVTELGFAVAEKGALTLKASLDVDPFDRGQAQWKFYQWKGAAQLVDEAGQVLAGATPSGQESQLIDETARAKAVEAGDQALAQAAGDLLSRYVFGR